MIEYFLIFILLALISFGVPLAEESVLLLAAYFAATGSSFGILMLASVLGICFSDTIMYSRGRFKSRFFKEFKRGTTFIKKTGFFAVFTARFFISSRVVLPFMAGALQMKKTVFHLASILSAVLSSVLFISVGSWAYGSLSLWAYGIATWMVLLIVVSGVLVMYATRSQVTLAR